MDPGSLMSTKFKKLKEICTQVHLCEDVEHQRQKNKHSKVVREKRNIIVKRNVRLTVDFKDDGGKQKVFE